MQKCVSAPTCAYLILPLSCSRDCHLDSFPRTQTCWFITPTVLVAHLTWHPVRQHQRIRLRHRLSCFTTSLLRPFEALQRAEGDSRGSRLAFDTPNCISNRSQSLVRALTCCLSCGSGLRKDVAQLRRGHVCRVLSQSAHPIPQAPPASAVSGPTCCTGTRQHALSRLNGSRRSCRRTGHGRPWRATALDAAACHWAPAAILSPAPGLRLGPAVQVGRNAYFGGLGGLCVGVATQCNAAGGSHQVCIWEYLPLCHPCCDRAVPAQPSANNDASRACISFEAHRERQSEERERNKATRRKLVHDPSLFFDILGEGKQSFRPTCMCFTHPIAAARRMPHSSALANLQPCVRVQLPHAQAIAGCEMRR